MNPLNKINKETFYKKELPLLNNENVDRAQNGPIKITVNFIFAFALSIILIFLAGYKVTDNPFQKMTSGEPFLVSPIISVNATKTVDLASNLYTETDKEELRILVNQYRADNNLSQLVFDEKLNDSAQAHAEDMFNRYYFSHTDPEGKTPFDRLNDKTFIKVGENIILQDMDIILEPKDALEDWIDSPPHKEALLMPDWELTGIGVKQGIRLNPKTKKEEPIIIWVQLFGLKEK